MLFKVPMANSYSGLPSGRSANTACICVSKEKSWARVRRDSSVTEMTLIVFSFVYDREHRGLLRRPGPKEASRIACDCNGEKECDSTCGACTDQRHKLAVEGRVMFGKRKESSSEY